MKKMKVKDIRNFVTQEASIVGEDEDLLKIAEEMVSDPKTRTVYVVNKENKLA